MALVGMRWMMGRVAIGLFVVVGCGGDDAATADLNCVPGQALACECTAGVVGAATCDAAGSGYGRCFCNAGGIGGIGGAAGIGGAGTGGAAGSGGMPSRTNGCDAADFPASGTRTIDVDGLQREFIVAVPDNYKASTPYKLIFAWHGQTITASQIAAIDYYGLRGRSGGTAIFVAAQGLNTTTGIGGVGWDNMNGRDIAFTRAMLDALRSSYCIDDERIFSVGMSYGGIMSNNVGCALGDVFRAIAPMAGLGPIGVPMPCVGQVATWIAYGDMDQLVPSSAIDRSRDHWVAANHCDATTQPAGPNGCVAYDGCDAGLPVTWCSFSGGHTVPSFASDEIWAFFSQF